MEVHVGIQQKERKTIAAALSKLLADTYTLYLKTHNFHWNVTGPLFSILHKTFEEQYQQLALKVDEIAERIRALGFPAPGSYKQFTKLTTIKEETNSVKAEEMIHQLVEGHEEIIRTARKMFPAVEKVNDEATADLLTEVMESHEKTAWMLRSMLEK